MSFILSKFSFHLQAKPVGIRNNVAAAAARDRVIEFGKHKGKMLGSLPSSYLKWVSKNLRAREFEEWAIMAEQVLEDPVYEDRIQWELAQNILSGGGKSTRASGEDVVSELLEISERFGWDWDNSHEAGWREVKFELLGTSKGGRIPRRNRATATKKSTENVSSEGGGRRKERRDRLRMNREQSKPKPIPIPTPTPNSQSDNPFPGRQSLLNRFTTTKSHLCLNVTSAS